MIKRIHYFAFTFLTLLICCPLWGQGIFVESFDYSAGDTLPGHGWTQIRSGTTAMTVTSPGLSHPEFLFSGVGNALSIVSTGGQEVKNTFTEQTADSMYVAYLINISETSLSGGIYLYTGSANVSIFDRRLTAYVRKDVSNNVAFGVAKNSGISYTGYNYALDTTYLIIMEYKFNPGVDDDRVSLWVNPSLTESKPVPDATGTSGNDATAFAEIVLSQLTAGNEPPDATIDEINVITYWNDPPTSIKESAPLTDRSYQLEQNYPNPFNPSTRISYVISDPGFISLRIYDILGREVQTLVDKYQAAGSYSVDFDGSKLSSGTYFYKLQVGTYEEMKKMLYLR